MGLFSRWRSSASGPAAQAAGVEAFWSWWRTEGAAATAGAIDAGSPGSMVEAIGDRVAAVHPGLGWELTAGSVSRHVLVVTSEGDPELRAVARRWRRAAPAADAVWDYSDRRLPAANPSAVTLSLGVDGVPMAASEVLVSARLDDSEVDVGLFHPVFGDLSEDDRLRATLLLLDQVLGEDDVETWVGAIEALSMSPLDPIPLVTLPDVVRQVRDMHVDEHGAPLWRLLHGEDPDGYPVVASAQVPLKPTVAPHLDTLVEVVVPYTDVTDDGLPDVGSLDALRRLEDHLAERLGDSGRVVANQSHRGVRILHVYVDGATPAAEQVRAAVGGWGQGKVTVRATHDPAWEGVAHLHG